MTSGKISHIQYLRNSYFPFHRRNEPLFAFAVVLFRNVWYDRIVTVSYLFHSGGLATVRRNRIHRFIWVLSVMNIPVLTLTVKNSPSS